MKRITGIDKQCHIAVNAVIIYPSFTFHTSWRMLLITFRDSGEYELDRRTVEGIQKIFKSPPKRKLSTALKKYGWIYLRATHYPSSFSRLIRVQIITEFLVNPLEVFFEGEQTEIKWDATFLFMTTRTYMWLHNIWWEAVLQFSLSDKFYIRTNLKNRQDLKE